MEPYVDLKYVEGRLAQIYMPHPASAGVSGHLHDRDGDPPFVTIAVADADVSFVGCLEPKIAESLTKELVKLFPTAGPRPTLSWALGQIADYLKETRPVTGLAPDETLALSVLRRALRLAKQDEEHNTLTQAGI